MGCRHHLFLDVNAAGQPRIAFDGEPWEMARSCSLDVADEGPHTQEAVGRVLAVTRERVRQIEVVALAQLAELELEVRPGDLDGEALHPIAAAMERG